MTRGGVDEGRCKPQDTDDDGADGHPNVEPAIYWESAHHSGCCHWSALVLHARRIPLFTLGECECPARQRGFNTAGLLAKYGRYTNQNPIFVATHIC
jgi:hypothetical protein